MSINRRGRNKGATKRAYLRVIQGGKGAKFDKNPDDIMKDVRGSTRNLALSTPNHGRATTSYKVLVENDEGGIDEVTRYTPVRSQPEVEAKKAMHRAMAGLPTQYKYKMIDTPLRKMWMIHQVFGTRHIYWIVWFDPLTNITKESITYATMESAMKHFKLNNIIWK